MIKDNITNMLYRRVPAAPDIYDLIWDYEARQALFFSSRKIANEVVETLFFEIFLSDACANVSLYKCLV